MRFPDWLYKLLPNDEGSQLLSVLWRESATNSSAASVSTTAYTVPSDKCLILTNATLRALPGAAQIVTRKRLMADPPSGSTRFNIVDDDTDSAVASGTTFNWQGEVIIPGGWKVRGEGTYDAGVNSNEVGVELHGYLVPRGTFIFG